MASIPILDLRSPSADARSSEELAFCVAFTVERSVVSPDETLAWPASGMVKRAPTVRASGAAASHCILAPILAPNIVMRAVAEVMGDSLPSVTAFTDVFTTTRSAPTST